MLAHDHHTQATRGERGDGDLAAMGRLSKQAYGWLWPLHPNITRATVMPPVGPHKGRAGLGRGRSCKSYKVCSHAQRLGHICGTADTCWPCKSRM